MFQMKEIKRVIDVKNSQAYVEWQDGTLSHTLTMRIPEDLLSQFYEEKRNEQRNYNRARL